MPGVFTDGQRGDGKPLVYRAVTQQGQHERGTAAIKAIKRTDTGSGLHSPIRAYKLFQSSSNRAILWVK